MEKASLRALDLLTIRADERAGEQLIMDWQAACENWGRFAREDAGRLGNGAKMLGEMQALIGATKGVLPERYCRMGHLNGLMRWASIYAKMQQDGELPKAGVIKGPIYQKFVERMQKGDELNRLQGMSEQEAQEAMALLAGERLDTAMMKVARECRRRLEQFLKDRELERIDHIVEKAYPKRQNGQKWPRGKMAAESYRRMERAREYMNLPADEVAERINDAKRKLDALDATDADFERKEEELEELAYWREQLLSGFGVSREKATNISVIDYTHEEERLFSLELIIEPPISNAEGMAAPASGRQAQHPNGVSGVRVVAFESFVKKEKAQIEREARWRERLAVAGFRNLMRLAPQVAKGAWLSHIVPVVLN